MESPVPARSLTALALRVTGARARLDVLSVARRRVLPLSRPGNWLCRFRWGRGPVGGRGWGVGGSAVLKRVPHLSDIWESELAEPRSVLRRDYYYASSEGNKDGSLAQMTLHGSDGSDGSSSDKISETGALAQGPGVTHLLTSYPKYQPLQLNSVKPGFEVAGEVKRRRVPGLRAARLSCRPERGLIRFASFV
ncbi:hypothetical protein CB1_001033049 [Camelus ferus]|nr:hypothetical protein CB1_001033049 [Camelus ferus]